jgi:hypothetical protein
MKRILIPSVLLFFITSCTESQQDKNNTYYYQQSSPKTTPVTQYSPALQPSSDYSQPGNNAAKEAIKPNYIPNIVTVDKITSDENYNHLLQITINNPYDKPITNIQVYISDDGNLSIPEDISEDNFYLRNMNIDPLQPTSSVSYTISTNDKGAEGRDYVVSARKIRFEDGTVVTP